jgi:SAM-dependent methyltransferase
MAKATQYFEWQARLLGPALGRRVIEVGCGIGSFTAHLSDREAVLATDSSAEMVDRTRARTAAFANVSVKTVDVMSPDFLTLRDWRTDSCVALNVLEHIEDDGTAVKQMADVLKEGGRLALFVPASPRLYGPVDANLGHVRRYTKDRVMGLVRDAGLVVENVRRVNGIGFFGWWLNAKVLRLKELPLGQIRFFDGWIVPWLEPIERVFEPPAGQSILLLARKDRAG